MALIKVDINRKLFTMTCKTVSQITYTVLVETLKPAQSINLNEFLPWPNAINPSTIIVFHFISCRPNLSLFGAVTVLQDHCTLRVWVFDTWISLFYSMFDAWMFVRSNVTRRINVCVCQCDVPVLVQKTTVLIEKPCNSSLKGLFNPIYYFFNKKCIFHIIFVSYQFVL